MNSSNTISPQTSPYQPRVNFHSIESLVSSDISSRDDDLNTSDKENHPLSTSKKLPRRKLSDWQIWHLRQTFVNSRYPTPYEQEQLASQLLLPLSSIRIWFQNHRARSGRN